MKEDVINLGTGQMVTAYLLVALSLIIINRNGIRREKDVLVASVRMSLQLMVAGLILISIMDSSSPWLSLFVLAFMEFMALFDTINPVKDKINKRMKGVIISSMLIGSISILLYFLIGIVRIKPFYDPQYLVTIGGMILGNSMTALSLTLNNMLKGVEDGREKIEGALMLGASPREAMREIIENTFDNSILPTLKKMMSMGTITLPGMMSGQILSGSSPMIAIKYQIAIMLAILASATVCVFLLLNFGYKCFFNDQDQLVDLVD